MLPLEGDKFSAQPLLHVSLEHAPAAGGAVLAPCAFPLVGDAGAGGIPALDAEGGAVTGGVVYVDGVDVGGVGVRGLGGGIEIDVPPFLGGGD